MGILLALYFSYIIVEPIHKIRYILNQLGKGKIIRINENKRKDEIGLMKDSVNNLCDSLNRSALFAAEIGKQNFKVDHSPLSDEDILGKSLINMRDDLYRSSEIIRQAQNIAKLGHWEYNINNASAEWSDELFRILELPTHEVADKESVLMEMIMDEDRTKYVKLKSKCISNKDSFSLECRVLTAKNNIKYISIVGQYIEGQSEHTDRIIGVIQDITIHKNAEAAITIKIEELKKINTELDKFVYCISHDLRAPLSSMLGIVLISTEDTEDELMKENLNLIKNSILRLDGFIHDILNYSQNARLEIKYNEIDFDELIALSFEIMDTRRINRNNIRFEKEIDIQTPVYSDKSRLKVVLYNLLSNSFRFHKPSSQQPYVKIKIKQDNENTMVSVVDNGIGIKSDIQPKVYDMFYRGSEMSDGAGLGLYIVKETIDKLGGSVEFHSAPEEGSEFTIKIKNTLQPIY